MPDEIPPEFRLIVAAVIYAMNARHGLTTEQSLNEAKALIDTYKRQEGIA